MAILIPTLIIAILGLAFGLLLGYAGKKFATEQDERVTQIRALLPGANCGGCGNPSCDAFAALVAAGKVDIAGCAVNSADNRKAIGALLGVKVEDLLPSAAVVLCRGTEQNCPKKAEYDGLGSCKAAAMAASVKGCAQACLGLGDCVRACAFDAISIQDSIAVVDAKKCTACGACVKQCPKDILKILPKGNVAHVLCSTRLVPREARDVCSTACIKCQLCVRRCPQKAMSLLDHRIEVNRELCTGCGICVEACPTKAIAMGEQ